MILSLPPHRREARPLVDVVASLTGLSAEREADDRERLVAWREGPDVEGLLLEIETARREPGAYPHIFESRHHAPLPDGVARRRLAVRADVTSRGNLSVRIAPEFYGVDGRWHDAPEWSSEHPFKDAVSTVHWARPSDEILFFRCVGPLFEDAGFHVLPRNPPWRLRRTEVHALEATPALFWQAVDDLAVHFDVAVARYPERAPDGRSLRLVDARREHRAAVRRRLEGFEAEFGLPLAEHARSEAGSAFLAEATLLGLYRPQDGSIVSEDEDALADQRFAWARLDEERRRFEELRAKAYASRYDWAAPARRRPADPPIDRKPVSAEVLLAALTPVRSAKPGANVPPPRPAPSAWKPSTVAAIDPALAEEIGVTDAMDLFRKLDAILAARGERPLPEGNLPTNKERLRKLVALYREETAAVPSRLAGV